ncbi:MAG: SF0329 family protein [Bacilli bacterium]
MQWSKLKQHFMQYVIPELRDCIDIHVTRYRRTHDERHEIWITVDGIKICGGGYDSYRMTDFCVVLDKSVSDIEHSIMRGDHDDFFALNIENIDVRTIMNNGIHDTSHFTIIMKDYSNVAFVDILHSNHPIYFAFGLVDRRLGKRRFERLYLADHPHPLVQEFYKLRAKCFAK